MNPSSTIDQVLADFKKQLGTDYQAYRNHAQRVYLIHQHLSGENPSEEVVIAAAFHDLGIWTNETWDYLDPSNALARRFCQEKELDQKLVASLILNHHKISSHKPNIEVENFRKADLIDFTRHAVRFGIGKKWLKSLMDTYPWHNFHSVLAAKFFKYAWKNPLRPFPMMKW